EARAHRRAQRQRGDRHLQAEAEDQRARVESVAAVRGRSEGDADEDDQPEKADRSRQSSSSGTWPKRARTVLTTFSTDGRRISARSMRRLPGKFTSVSPMRMRSSPCPGTPGSAMM